MRSNVVAYARHDRRKAEKVEVQSFCASCRELAGLISGLGGWIAVI